MRITLFNIYISHNIITIITFSLSLINFLMGQSPSTLVSSPDLNRREVFYTNRFGYGSVDSSDESVNGGLCRDYTDEIPDECLASIFQFVDSVDRKRCSAVCHRWLRVEGESRRRLSLNAEAKLLDVVPSLFSRFDSITKLALRCSRKFTSINDDALILISSRCKNLKRLKLRGCREITEIGMLGLAKNCKLLKKLSCGSCMFGVKGIHAVIDNCMVLEELSVKRLRGNNADADSFIPSGGSSSLKSICLKELVHGDSYVSLINCSKKLKTLKIIGCLGDWDAMLANIGKLNLELVEIHLEKIQVSDVGLAVVSNCLKLEALHLVKTPECSDVGLSEVAENCKMLKKLHIDGWKTNRIGDDGLISVAKHCRNLQELVLIAMSPTSLSLAAIASSCLALERFALCGIGTVSDADIECIAAKCVSLKKLCIKGCPVSDAGIAAFASGSPNLIKLKVRKCSKVTGDVVELLREKRGSLAFNVDYSRVEVLDGSGGDVGGGVQEITVTLPQINTQQVTLADDAPSSSNNNNNRMSMFFRTRFGFLAFRSFVPCAFKRWTNIDTISCSSFS